MRSVLLRAAAVILVAGPLVFVAAPAFAANPSSDFTYSLTGSTATITNYVGAGTTVDIPATITDGGVDYTVTAIADNAFRGNYTGKYLTSVAIPDTVVSIGDNAFRGDLLASVVIPDSVVSIGTYAFYNNLIANLSLGDSLTSIGNNAFRANSLTALSIPASVTSIGNSTFADNTTELNTLASVVFAGSAPTLGTTTFFAGAGLVLYYYAGATGFSPTWGGYTVREISAADSELALVPTDPVPADGVTPITLTATVRDDTSAVVAGVPVTFTLPADVTASAGACTTGADGSCAISITSTTGGTYTVSAKVGSDPSLLTQSVTFSSTSVTVPPTAPVHPILARTGINVAEPLSIGLVVLAAGLVLLGAARLRRSESRDRPERS